MTSSIQTAIDLAIKEQNINHILTALLDADLYAVCTEQDGQDVLWLVPSQENKDIPVVTVSERRDWLESVMADNPARNQMSFRPVAGEDLAVMGVNDKVEVYIQFAEQAYRIPRSYFNYWAEAATAP